MIQVTICPAAMTMQFYDPVCSLRKNQSYRNSLSCATEQFVKCDPGHAASTRDFVMILLSTRDKSFHFNAAKRQGAARLLRIKECCLWHGVWELLSRHFGLGIIGAHDDVMKWKHFPRYWPFLRGIHRIHRSPMNYPQKGQSRRAFVFSLICVWKKKLSKQSGGWWFETLSRPLWCHCNGSGALKWSIL